MNDQKKNQLKARLLPTMLKSMALPLIICIALPFEIYANNLQEFNFSLSGFFFMAILVFLVFAFIIFITMIFLPEKAYKIYSAIYVGITIMFFIQGTYLNGGLNSLAGDSMGSETSTVSIIINSMLWVFVIALCVFFAFAKFSKNIWGTLSAVMLVIVSFSVVISPITTAVSNPQIFVKKEDRLVGDLDVSQKVLTYKNITTLSRNKNVFVFCVDRFDEYYAEQAYEVDPSIYAELDGFVSYTDNIATYGHTYPSISYLLTNNTVDLNNKREEHLNSVYSTNKTLSVLNDNDYMINLYTQQYYAYSDANYLPNYVTNVSEVLEYRTNNSFMSSLIMMGMGLYRCFPSALKQLLFYVSSDSFSNYTELVTKDAQSGYMVETDIIDKKISNSDFVTVDKNLFTFLHTQGIHNVNVDYVDNTQKQSNKTVNAIVKAVKDNFKIINQYIRELKNNGLYKDATIIITGDHSAPVNDNIGVEHSRLTALFVKRSGSEATPLQFSSKQVSHNNLWATIMQSENITTENDYGKSVFDIVDGENVERSYVWQTYTAGKTDEYTYKINGSGRTFDNWQLENCKHYDHFIMD